MENIFRNNAWAFAGIALSSLITLGLYAAEQVRTSGRSWPHQPQVMVDTFAADKEAGAHILVAHMSDTTREAFLESMKPGRGTPAGMVAEWAAELHQVLAPFKQQPQLPKEVQFPEDVQSALDDDYTEALMLTYTSDVEKLQGASPAVSIEELRELIVGQFVRINALVEKTTHDFSFVIQSPERYNDTLSTLLYGLCGLTLQRWAEHDLSREQLGFLFEKQYRAVATVIPAIGCVVFKIQERAKAVLRATDALLQQKAQQSLYSRVHSWLFRS